MSAELIGIFTVGIGLSGLMVGMFAWLRPDIRRMDDRIASLDRGQAELRERMAKLEGLLEGLREVVTGRRAAS